jgi:23S rRNA pseudouridine1911/1915/1917 synthase
LSATDARERLDHYLVRLGFVPSRRAARELIAQGRVRVNGRPRGKSELVASSDKVELTGGLSEVSLDPNSNVTLEILFKDAAVLVVNKPAPMPCHPLRPGERGTVMNGVIAQFPGAASVGDNPREGGLIHRLDNGTSGALLVALQPRAFTELRTAIRSGRVQRTYKALIDENLKQSLEINSPIAHRPHSARRMLITTDANASARPASTRVEPIRPVGRFTLVAVTPRTGMRHQIRVHLAHAGYPIAGDELYGGPPMAALAAGRFWLHLAEIEFRSPASGPVRVRSPLPRDLEDALAEARRTNRP